MGGQARPPGLGRNTLWHGEIAVEGARIAELTPVNQWNPERRLERVDDRTIAFEAVTSGKFAGVDSQLDGPGRIRVRTNHVTGAVALDDQGLEDTVLGAGGLERQIRLRRLSETLDQSALEVTIPIDLAGRNEAALWVRLTTLDRHMAWSSPICPFRD